MSAVAALAASEDRNGSLAGAPKRRLRSVPVSGPAGRQEEALRLGRKMRLRLRAAVQALLADPSLDGLGDTARLATIVLYAKSRASRGRKNDLQTSIWCAELGRWLGVSTSTIHHDVLPPLKRTDALHTQVVPNEWGHPTGLDCLVMPLWHAHRQVKKQGGKHPLVLSKVELAVLLRLIEALFGPGWEPEGKGPTPPGLLAGRTGRGAATDRLALLMMVLSTRSSGWLELRGGSVKVKAGRGAATLARMLGCSPSGARKVLARLVAAGAVRQSRKATATRMRGRARVMVLPVAHAYGRAVDQEVAEPSTDGLSVRPAAAVGDLAPGEPGGTRVAPGESESEGAVAAEFSERPAGAVFHADHTPVVTPVPHVKVSGGCSGEGRGGAGRRPERACVREDQAVDGEGAAAGSASPVAGGGPLRGEQPEKASISNRTEPDCGDLAATVAPSVDAAGPGTRGHTTLPPLDVRGVLGPVRWLWAKIERSGTRTTVVRRTRAALDELAEIVGPDQAAPALTARLTRRLHDQGGEALVTDPAAWIIGRGLPQQHTGCGDARCDGGHRLDTSTDCEACADRHADRQALRRQAAAAIDARHPHLTGAARRTAIEDHLHTEVQHAALLRQARHDRQAAERAARRTGAPLPALRAWPGRDKASGKSTCRECGARIVLAGPAAQDLLCGACHRESTTLAAGSSAATPASTVPSACTQTDRRGRPCSRPPVPDHDVCVRHLAHALTGRPSS
ncbi:hypothetical protein [Streptomyces sp. 604F]|uniref:hypothetical protein n=1 Tax=Streptomyces sp. 604F TaxID=1476754 RepID=UPI0013DD51C9|nr:hypothetical protein [Streptomyces sp. 604F]